MTFTDEAYGHPDNPLNDRADRSMQIKLNDDQKKVMDMLKV